MLSEILSFSDAIIGVGLGYVLAVNRDRHRSFVDMQITFFSKTIGTLVEASSLLAHLPSEISLSADVRESGESAETDSLDKLISYLQTNISRVEQALTSAELLVLTARKPLKSGERANFEAIIDEARENIFLIKLCLDRYWSSQGAWIRSINDNVLVTEPHFVSARDERNTAENLVGETRYQIKKIVTLVNSHFSNITTPPCHRSCPVGDFA
jgi:hypothetical protein